MFIGFDGFISYLAAPVSTTSTSLQLESVGSICTGLAASSGPHHTYLRISDGTNQTTVRVVGCSGGLLLLESPVGTAYPRGACVRFVLTSQMVCELISQGGCSTVAAPPPAACTPVSLVAGAVLGDVPVGTPFEHVIAWTGTGPFNVSVLLKPSWMTVSPTGSTNNTSVLLSGTAPDTSSKTLQLLIQGCNDSKIEIVQRICYCEQAGV